MMSSMSPCAIKANAALSPNQFIGTSTNVSLMAARSGADLASTWPTNSALVDLMSSPVLGRAAVWAPVTAGTVVVAGGNYTVSLKGRRRRSSKV
jgi:hypothetical protein